MQMSADVRESAMIIDLGLKRNFNSQVNSQILWAPDGKSRFIGKDPGKERRQDGITDSMDMSLSKLQEMMKDR